MHKITFFRPLLSFFCLSLLSCGQVERTTDSFVKSEPKSENKFQEKWNSALSFFNNTKKGYFFSGEIPVFYRQYLNPNSKKHIVILHGLTEGAHNYIEMIYDLYNAGFSVHIYNLTGMGESGRGDVNDIQIVDVDSFQRYYNDTHNFIENYVVPTLKEGHKLYMLTHSTGGLVAANYLAAHPGRFTLAALESPLFSVNTGGKPKGLVSTLVSTLAYFNPQGFAPSFGHKEVRELKFEEAGGTLSRERWTAYNNLIQKRLDIYTSGPSNRWLNEAFNETAPEKITKLASMQTIPVRIYEGTQDKFVDVTANQLFINHSPLASLVTIPDAYHEIYRERDHIRQPFLDDVISYFNSDW